MPFNRQLHRRVYQQMLRNLRHSVTLLTLILSIGGVAVLASQQPERAVPRVAPSRLGPVQAPYQRPEQTRIANRALGTNAATHSRRDTTLRISTLALVLGIILLVVLLV